MKKSLSIILFCLATIVCQAQYHIYYSSFGVGGTDTSHVKVTQAGDQLQISSADTPPAHPIPGIGTSTTYVDYALDSIFSQRRYADSTFFCSTDITHYQYEKAGTERILGYLCDKYIINLFSNKIELWVTKDLKVRATPISSFASLPGTLVQYCRNGNAYMQLTKVVKDKKLKQIVPAYLGTRKGSKELNQTEVDRKVLTKKIFEDDQICFNPGIQKPVEFPYDSVIRCANGTLILKRVKMDLLPEHYKIFAEITEYSNGDAYDRTGSIFIIPASTPKSMLQAFVDSVGVLPIFTDRNGSQYQGIVKTDNYLPAIEMVRFFTPFGVRHYNQYRSLSDREWADEVYYKQDVSELRPWLSGDVYIGAYIGNYDKGGHKLSLTLKAYPEGDTWSFSDDRFYIAEPLFNTCNIMEMAGQNYGSFFRTDSLTVTFEVPANAERLLLRYITTGHGGWDTGDEFVPKENVILIDGKRYYSYTPWREDCGTHRTSNPASGNFWNGMSSSDYSRSGWCPGTATQPTYINLTGLKPGKHTLTVAIPEGEPEGGSFSSWNVSGILIGQYRK